MGINTEGDIDPQEALIEFQHSVIQAQANRIDSAITMLEDLVIEDDVDPDKIEKIIKVLMDGE